jgi:AraC-like DNA-binding protein
MKQCRLSERAVKFILSRRVEELTALTAVKVAGSLGIDAADLCRQFEKDQSMSLERFILREKIYRALFMIEKNRDISQKTLAARLGFTSIQDFAAEFETFLLVKPHKYIYLKKKHEALLKLQDLLPV